MDIPKIGGQILSSKVKEILLDLMKKGSFDDKRRLPPESDISEAFGVSRSVIRDVYASLELEGYIIRRRGWGTLINYPVLNNSLRLDLESEFLRVVREAGHEPTILEVDVSRSTEHTHIHQDLHLEEGQEIIRIDRTIAADGEPVIYCINCFSSDIVKREIQDEKEYRLPVYDFFHEYCGTAVHFELSRVQAIAMDPTVAGKLKRKKGDPVLYLKEIAYDIEQVPLLWSKVYHLSDRLKYTLYRKKI